MTDIIAFDEHLSVLLYMGTQQLGALLMGKVKGAESNSRKFGSVGYN